MFKWNNFVGGICSLVGFILALDIIFDSFNYTDFEQAFTVVLGTIFFIISFILSTFHWSKFVKGLMEK